MKKKIVVLLALVFVAVSAAGTNPPAVFFNSILNNTVFASGAGYLSFRNMWVADLPQEAAEGKIVVSREGTAIYNFKWKYGQSDPPDTLIEIAQATDAKTGEHVGMATLTEPGNYTFDFVVLDKKFYTYPFKLTKIGESYFLEGAWADWGFLSYPDGDPLRELTWKMWLRNYADEDKKLVKVSAEIVRDKDKKVICAADPNRTWTLQKEWQRFEFAMMNPPGHPSGEKFTKTKYLLEADGAYTLTVKVLGQPYGVWKFNVKGGKLEYTGRTLRGKTDPMTYIHGGAGAYWYEKQK